MNIFASYDCPVKCAETLDNKRVVKMILETSQILSTAIYLHSNVHFSGLYRPTHIKHPCILWAAKTRSNWDWLFNHFIALLSEYALRYEKTHKCTETIDILLNYAHYIPEGPRTSFANCTNSPKRGIDFRKIEDPHEAYQKYLNLKWQSDARQPAWHKREKPYFFTSA